jgi:7,8-dihydroneopterin aldolase/epimerase/oxygenase
VTDRIVLQNLQFVATHGYYEHEQRVPQPFEVDIELRLNLQPAGIDDDLEKTIDYGRVYAIVRQVMVSTTFRLIEALAEAISHEILAEFDVLEVGVRVRKPQVDLGGPLDYAAVEIWRRRQ